MEDGSFNQFTKGEGEINGTVDTEIRRWRKLVGLLMAVDCLRSNT